MKRPTRPEGTPVLCYDRSPLEAAADWRFRSTNDLSALDQSVNRKGLANLRLSGSASLSSREQVEHIQRIAQGSPVIVIDLRQETHAIVNNAYPVTSVLPNNWANVGKSHDEVLSEEAALIAELSRQSEVTLLRYKDVKKGTVPPHSIILQNPAAVSERDVVESTGTVYVRFTITDHVKPGREDIDRFIHVVQQMPGNAWLHVHCKGGKGRTTTAMAMYDMLHNAQDVPVEDIIHRHKVLGPGCDLLATGGREELRGFKQDRKEFLFAFHEYAKANPLGYPQNWSAWRNAGENANVVLISDF